LKKLLKPKFFEYKINERPKNSENLGLRRFFTIFSVKNIKAIDLREKHKPYLIYRMVS
jgi:hypothetical protein